MLTLKNLNLLEFESCENLNKRRNYLNLKITLKSKRCKKKVKNEILLRNQVTPKWKNFTNSFLINFFIHEYIFVVIVFFKLMKIFPAMCNCLWISNLIWPSSSYYSFHHFPPQFMFSEYSFDKKRKKVINRICLILIKKSKRRLKNQQFF